MARLSFASAGRPIGAAGSSAGVIQLLHSVNLQKEYSHWLDALPDNQQDSATAEALRELPKALRWAVLKRRDGRLTEAQVAALAELEASDLFTAIAWRIKEKLRWVRQAQSVQAARWRLTNFLRHANDQLDPDPLLDPVRKAIGTVATYSKRILQRWTSPHSNARLEGLNGLFQAARARARGYRSITTFATIIYLIATPLGDLFKST